MEAFDRYYLSSSHHNNINNTKLLSFNRSIVFSINSNTHPNSATMKFSLAVAASMATASVASPIFGNHWGLKWGNKKEEVAAKGPCKSFASAISIHQ